MRSKIKLDQLTGLRYVAALLVFLSHLKWNGTDEFFVRIFDSGYVGVSFFFMLSGFILSYSYSDNISNRSIGFRKYLLRRLAKLTPLHFLTAAPFAVLSIHKSDFDISRTLANLFYLQSWIPSSPYYFSLNAPSWSLSNEMFFYVCFFSFVFLTPKAIFRTFLALLAIVFLSAYLVEDNIPGKVLWGGSTFSHWLFYIFPGFRLVEFIAGILLYKAWQSNIRITRWLALPSYGFLFCAMYYAKDVPESFRVSLYFLPFITLFFYTHLTENTILHKFYSNKILVLLGNASFSFYLIHQPLIAILRRITANFNMPNFAFFAFSVIVISALSIVTYLSYERRSERFLKGLIDRKFP